MKRRDFVELMSAGAIGASTGKLNIVSALGGNLEKLTILHTNDWHSRIEPFPMDGSRNQGLGGASKRAAMIRKVRAEEKNLLLLDSGDIFQGTPYFNFYNGELEFKLMSEMGYDASTIGNHDYDAGMDNLGAQMSNASFDFLCANYEFSHRTLKEKVLPYKIFNKGGLKIGIFGLGIELEGLVPKTLYKDTRYIDPVVTGNKIARHLKEEKKCDLVVCLSHLGYKYRSNKISDVILAKKSSHIDIILGGHTHTFMKQAVQEINSLGKSVLINQVGWAGILLGRIDIYFEKHTGWKWRSGSAQAIS